jgi:hypothetical protein
MTPRKVLLDHRLGKTLEMSLHEARRTGIEGVVFVKHPRRIGLLHDLKHPALSTKRRRELKKILIRDLVGVQEPVRDRHSAKSHEWFDCRTADSALHYVVSSISKVVNSSD